MDEDVREVVRREQLLLDPVVRASPDRVRELLHPDYVEHGASGRIWGRESVVASLAEEPELRGTGTDFSSTRLSREVILLTYRVAGDHASLRSSVWVLDPDAGWRLRFHQGTRADHPA